MSDRPQKLKLSAQKRKNSSRLLTLSLSTAIFSFAAYGLTRILIKLWRNKRLQEPKDVTDLRSGEKDHRQNAASTREDHATAGDDVYPLSESSNLQNATEEQFRQNQGELFGTTDVQDPEGAAIETEGLELLEPYYITEYRNYINVLQNELNVSKSVIEFLKLKLDCASNTITEIQHQMLVESMEKDEELDQLKQQVHDLSSDNGELQKQVQILNKELESKASSAKNQVERSYSED